MSAQQQLEVRLQQIAQRVTPCPAPDVSEGWDLCAHGLPWPCPSTEAAWIARGLDRDEQVRAAQTWLRGERDEAYAATAAAAVDGEVAAVLVRQLFPAVPRPGAGPAGVTL